MTSYSYTDSPTGEIELGSQLPKYSAPSSPPPAYSLRQSYENATSSVAPFNSDTEALGAFEFGFEHRDQEYAEDRDHHVSTSSPRPPRIRLQRSRTEIEANLEALRLYFRLAHLLWSTILLCVVCPAIKLYERPWSQIGDGNTAFGMAGSIVTCIAAIAAVGLVAIGYICPVFGLILECVEMSLYSSGAVLLGYGTYVTRGNQVCYGSRCSSISLDAGWRCGIVVVILCIFIVLQQSVYVLIWTYYKLQMRRSSRKMLLLCR